MSTRRKLQYALAAVCVAVYLVLVGAYFAQGNLSLWTPVIALAAIYLADLAGGIAHFVIDYTPNVQGVGLYEMFHFKGNKGGKKYVRMRNEAMKKINAWQELVFDFKVHHLTPMALGRRSIAQMTLPIIVFADLPITLVLLGLGDLGLGVLPANLSLFILIFLLCATLSQYAHACTHKPELPAIVRGLQAVGLFVSEETHDVHHQHPDRAFCLLNGWANPVVDVLFQATLKLGIYKEDGLEVI